MNGRRRESSSSAFSTDPGGLSGRLNERLYERAIQRLARRERSLSEMRDFLEGLVERDGGRAASEADADRAIAIVRQAIYIADSALPEVPVVMERVGQEDLPLFITSVAIVSSSGGNLTEILENLTDVIRMRVKMRRKVRALSAETGKAVWRFDTRAGFQAAVERLLAQPGRELRVFDPDGASLLLNDPSRIAALESRPFISSHFAREYSVTRKLSSKITSPFLVARFL